MHKSINDDNVDDAFAPDKRFVKLFAIFVIVFAPVPVNMFPNAPVTCWAVVNEFVVVVDVVLDNDN